MIRNILSIIIFSAPFCTYCVADVPAQELIIIKSDELSELLDDYDDISDIPIMDLIENCDYHFSGSNCAFNNFSVSTPYEKLYISLGSHPQPTNTYTLSFKQNEHPENDIKISGELEYVSPQPILIKPANSRRKTPKIFQKQSYAISKKWQDSDYALLIYFFNLKK